MIIIEWLVKGAIAYLLIGTIFLSLLRGWLQQPPPSAEDILFWARAIPYETAFYASQQGLFNSHYQPAVYYGEPPKRRIDQWR